jgi:hypothetical protein
LPALIVEQEQGSRPPASGARALEHPKRDRRRALLAG